MCVSMESKQGVRVSCCLEKSKDAVPFHPNPLSNCRPMGEAMLTYGP